MKSKHLRNNDHDRPPATTEGEHAQTDPGESVQIPSDHPNGQAQNQDQASRLFPFSAIIGQEDLKLSLILNAINPHIGGVLIRGEKGTAESTAVRALAEILPVIEHVKECPFRLAITETGAVCKDCMTTACPGQGKNEPGKLNGGKIETEKSGIRVIELPVGATEDRVVGTMDLEHALKKGEKRIEPGLLAAANRARNTAKV